MNELGFLHILYKKKPSYHDTMDVHSPIFFKALNVLFSRVYAILWSKELPTTIFHVNIKLQG